jgi:Type II secretion system (T2SS), protein E, N-terminal domain
MARGDVKHERTMADMPGALLLRAGVLRAKDLAAANVVQERDGGSFGECLVRLGLLDEERLADFYQSRLMISRLPDHRLVNIPKKALALVSADMAAEFRVVPVELDGDGGLVLAMADPTDNHAVDEVAFFADHFVVRVVATESGIRDAIERHYGVRFTSPRAADSAVPATVAATPSAPVAATPSAPVATPAQTIVARKPAVKPGPLTEAPLTRPPNPSPPPPTSRRIAPSIEWRAETVHVTTPEPTTAPAAPTAEDDGVVLLTKVKFSDATPLPQPVPPPDDYTPAYLVDDPAHDEPILLTEPKVAAPNRPRRDTLQGLQQMTVPDPPLAELRAAQHRDEIAHAVLDYMARLLRRACFFVIKKSILTGYDARGADLDQASVRRLVINVAAPSLFRDVIASRLPYRGPLPETPANRAFAYAIGGIPGDVLLMPIAVRDRVIAVLFADGAAQPLPDAALHATIREAGLAYERLILEAKR